MRLVSGPIPKPPIPMADTIPRRQGDPTRTPSAAAAAPSIQPRKKIPPFPLPSLSISPRKNPSQIAHGSCHCRGAAPPLPSPVLPECECVRAERSQVRHTYTSTRCSPALLAEKKEGRRLVLSLLSSLSRHAGFAPP
uniref:Uncharacterized protein n=1 Tax=Hordeum vulgare subsp. vulgare TaxID=112509 RepID=A0A8I7BFH5_HORVV